MNKEDSLSLFNQLKSYGEVHKTKKSIIFFGNDSFTTKVAQELFPQGLWLHQIHSDRVIEANNKKEKADGHFTLKKSIPLFIKTADCMPLMLEMENSICAIHAGWRGVAQKILTQAIKKLNSERIDSLWVGPHINQYRFSLDAGSTQELLSQHSLSLKEALELEILKNSFEQKNHFWIDLKSLLFREAFSLNIKDIYFSETDTYRSFKHYSHRRHPYRNGNNFSFIMKI